MKAKNLHYFFGACVFLLLVSLLVYTEKGMFMVSEEGAQDGFYSQMSIFMGGWELGALRPMQYVHLVRFVAVFPFLIEEKYDLGAFYLAVVILFFSLPVLKVNVSKKYNLLKWLILLFPLFISFRAFLVACSIAYLFIALYHHRSQVLVVLSLLLALLSSGVVMVWIAIVVINLRLFVKTYRGIGVISLFSILLLFSVSLLSKQEYAQENLGSYDDYFLRATIVVSYINEEWPRFIVYLGMIVYVVITAMRPLVYSRSKAYYFSFFPFLLGAMFEGLGLICGAIVILMLVAGFRPLVRPEGLQIIANYFKYKK